VTARTISRSVLVEVLGAGPLLALDDAVLLQLLDQRGVGARLLDHVVERVQRAAAADRDARAPRLAPLGGLGDVTVLLRAARASSWRMTRSGRNSSRWRRRIVRRRCTSVGA